MNETTPLTEGTLFFSPVSERADRVAIIASGPSYRWADFKDLAKYVHVIAVKGAIEGVSWANSWITVDANRQVRFRWMSPRRRKAGCQYYAAVPPDFGLPTARLLWHRNPPEPNIHWLERRPGIGLSEDPKVIHTGNSAFAALGLAYHMGAKKIGLFGIDGTQERYGIGAGRPKGSLIHLAGLMMSAEHQLRQAGVEVRNGGSLDAFDKHEAPEVIRWLNDA